MNNFAIKLGKRIRELREKNSFSREKLAELANISTKYLGDIERGEVNVSAIILDRIANTFKIDLSELLKIEHQSNNKELHNKIILLINDAKHEDLQVIYKILTAILK